MSKDNDFEAGTAAREAGTSQSALRFFVQYLLSPILIVSIGTLINWRIERDKEQSNRIDVAEKMIAPLFSNNPEEAFATEVLLARVVDPDVASELHSIVTKYYQSKIDSDLKAGNVESAAKIVTAAKAIGSPAGEQIMRSVEQDPAKSEAIQNQTSKAETAARYERQGFADLLAGDYDGAAKGFQAAEDAYHSYHEVYELARLVKAKKADLSDPVKRKEVFQLILNQYSHGLPPDLLERLREKAR